MGDRKVAFTALADHGGPCGPFSADRTLHFNNPITNIGGGYSPGSGIFTAPVAGLYYFTYFFHTGSQEKTELTLIKNGDIVVTASVTISDLTSGGGNAAVLNLKQDDRVSVRLPANSRVWGANNATSFSGFLICENSVIVP